MSELFKNLFVMRGLLHMAQQATHDKQIFEKL
jgi:hypothetical protein